MAIYEYTASPAVGHCVVTTWLMLHGDGRGDVLTNAAT
jgi:hypothetical protein